MSNSTKVLKITRTPGLNTLGFVFSTERETIGMKEETKPKTNDRINWAKNHTLTPEQREKIITQKLELIKQQFKAWADVRQRTEA